MNIAIEGCLHGELDQVYYQLSQIQKKTGIKIDALLICGDFQAMRDEIDLDYMHCPPKYKQLGSFQKYYSGELPTPYLTIFIGGNHQAVNYMRDLYFGGWVAPNIYYLGQAGSIYLTKGKQRIRISGLSGIYNDYDFKYCLKTERTPLMGKSKVSCYHIKQIQIFRMELLSRIEMMKAQDPTNYGNNTHPFDIYLTHDWPKDIALYGNMEKLLQAKGFLKDEIEAGTLGSLPSGRILSLAQPNYWFAAHMHVKFPALFPHQSNKYTHFLALDKCLNNKACIQILQFLHKNNPQLISQTKVSIELDRQWLLVLKLTLALQIQNRSLYKSEDNNKTLKLLDIGLMNGLIKKYSQIRNQALGNSKPFQQNLVKWQGEQQKGTQIHQTKYLIQDILHEDHKIFKGTIFSSQDNHEPEKQQHNPDKQHQQNNDQIQLDL